jgi:hypothetical protein
MYRSLIALAGVAAIGLTSAAYAQRDGVGAVEVSDKVISVSGIGFHRTFPCNGRKLEVSGSAHVITTTGECASVEVSGSDNTVDASLIPNGTLEVAGSQHTVHWKSSGKIKQDVSGTDHKISRTK